MRLLTHACFAALSLGLAAGCGPSEQFGEMRDAAPLEVKDPPTSGGGTTAPGCNGVTDRGLCLDGSYVYCDLRSGEQRTVDCASLGEQCVFDPARGASCSSVGDGSGDTGGACNGAVDASGYCSAGGAAVWCDADADQIVSWDCGADGKVCKVDSCADGAYCCDKKDTGGTTDPGNPECQQLGLEGECAGNTVRYCGANNSIVELDCTAQGLTCQVNQCGQGAFCCSSGGSTPNQCDTIGWYGACEGNTLSYCTGDELTELECTGDNVCAADVCFDGAACCSPTQVQSACDDMGLYGKCAGPADQHMMWCDSQGEIHTVDCKATGKTCAVDQCGYGVQCC